MNRFFCIFVILFVLVACKSNNNALVGAYGKTVEISPEVRALFIQAMKNDVRFTPVKVRTQVVAGRGEPRIVSIDGKPF